MIQKKFLQLMGFISFLYSSLSFSQIAPIGGAKSVGLGGVAEQLAEGPVLGMEQLFYGMCYIAGMFMIYRGYQGLKAHRANPHHAGLVNPVLLILLGTILIFLPLTYRLADKLY